MELLWKKINKWEISFRDTDKFDDFGEVLRFIKNGQPAQSREKPHLVIQKLWRTVIHEAVEHMREKGMNIHQRMAGTIQAKVVMRNNDDEHMDDNIKGNYYTKGYGQSKKGSWEKFLI